MKRWAMLGLLTLATAAPGAALATEAVPLSTRITEVTAYADRARVTRVAPVDLGKGLTRFVVTGLPGWIDADSVRAALTPASAGRIVDVAVEKTFLVEPSETGVREAETALREVNDKLAAIADEEAVLRADIAQYEGIRAFQLDKLPKDMATRDVKVKTFAATLDFVSAGLRKSRAAIRALAEQRRELAPELQARQNRHAELNARAKLERRQIMVEIDGHGRAQLALTYLTPGATWEPTGELRVSADGRDVKLLQVASVVQSTGEDWSGATLRFSTQRPGQTLSVPQVQELLLGANGGGLNEAVQRAGESFKQAAAAYSSQNAIANRHNVGWQQEQVRQSQMQARAQAAFAQLRRRGTTAHFSALSARTVRSDGKPVRVPIAEGDFAATVRLVAVPEVSLNVVRTADIVNTGEQPILPGRAMLFVDGAFVGTSEFPFVASGESFSTFLGVDERIKLERTIDRKRSSFERGRKRTKVRASFIVSAENLSEGDVTIELGDRVPVAQTDDIEIDDIKTPKTSKRSRGGVVTWTATVAPRKRSSWRIEYTLEYPNDFVARGRQSPAKPAPASRMLFDQIDELELQLK